MEADGSFKASFIMQTCRVHKVIDRDANLDATPGERGAEAGGSSER